MGKIVMKQGVFLGAPKCMQIKSQSVKEIDIDKLMQS